MPNQYPSPPGENQRGFPTQLVWGRWCSHNTASRLLPPHKRKSYFVFPRNQPGLEGQGKSRGAKGLQQPLTLRGVPTAPDSTRVGPQDIGSPREARAAGARREGCASRASPRSGPEAHLRVLPDGVGRSPGVPRHSSLASAPLATYPVPASRSSCCPGWGTRPGARCL